MSWFLPALGKAALGVVSGFIGSKLGAGIDRKSARDQRADQFAQYGALGLTPQEIIGGAAGGTAQGNSTVLGNQAAELAKQQMTMEFQKDQKDKDRALISQGQQVQMANAQTMANASMANAQTAAGASMYGSDTQGKIASAKLALEQDKFKNVQLPQALNDLATSTPDWKRQELLARMGVDNILATAIAGARGIDVMDPATLDKLSDIEFKELVIDIYGMQSHIFGETAGASKIIGDGVNEGTQAITDGTNWFKNFIGLGSDEPSVLGNQ